MLWWPIIKHLTETIAALPELAGFHVYAGSKGGQRLFPCVEVIFDDEEDTSLHVDSKGIVSFCIDVHVREDTNDPAKAYERMFVTQSAIIECMRGWGEKLKTDLAINTNVKQSGIVSDGDTRRPVYGVRMNYTAEWRKKARIDTL